MAKNIIVAATGASGLPLLVECLKIIKENENFKSYLIMSESKVDIGAWNWIFTRRYLSICRFHIRAKRYWGMSCQWLLQNRGNVNRAMQYENNRGNSQWICRQPNSSSSRRHNKRTKNTCIGGKRNTTKLNPP